VKTIPLIEGKPKKEARKLCKDCAPADWIKCYETNGKFKQCEHQKAKG